MATILVNPLLVAPVDSPEVVNLHIQVQDVDWLGKFTKLQVFRASSSTAPFTELTGPGLEPAMLPAGVGPADGTLSGPSLVLVGKSLEVLANERFPVTITFTGVDPLTTAAAATQVTQQGQGRVAGWVDDTGQLAVATLLVGSGASLQILGGDAAPLLRLPLASPENAARGREARIPLLSGKVQYVFSDLQGSRGCLYKVRFFNHVTGAVSAYSESFSASNAVGLPTEQLVTGYASLVDSSGRPARGRCVHLHMEYTGDLLGGATVIGGDVEHFTDERGYVEFSLVRGQYYTVSFPGSDLMRQIRAPLDTSVERFNLLDPEVVTGQDRFQVVVPSLVGAERRTL